MGEHNNCGIVPGEGGASPSGALVKTQIESPHRPHLRSAFQTRRARDAPAMSRAPGACAMTRNDVADQIVHTTVRIETVSAEGKCASGTGFFVQFCAQEGQSVPAIVTNRHVVEGAERGAIHMTRSDGGGQPIFGEHVRLPISHFGNGSIPHPDPDIDLVALPMALLLHHFAQQGERVFYKSWKLSDIADEAYLAGLTAIEDILMVGYPNGGIRRITCPSFGGA